METPSNYPLLVVKNPEHTSIINFSDYKISVEQYERKKKKLIYATHHDSKFPIRKINVDFGDYHTPEQTVWQQSTVAIGHTDNSELRIYFTSLLVGGVVTIVEYDLIKKILKKTSNDGTTIYPLLNHPLKIVSECKGIYCRQHDGIKYGNLFFSIVIDKHDKDSPKIDQGSPD